MLFHIEHRISNIDMFLIGQFIVLGRIMITIHDDYWSSFCLDYDYNY